MKTRFTAVLFPLLVAFAAPALAQKPVTGEVRLSTEAEARVKRGGTLILTAHHISRPEGDPVALVQIKNPKFPQKFSIGAHNATPVGTPFLGPFRIAARYSPTGQPEAKEGVLKGEATAAGKSRGIPAGTSEVRIVLR